MGAKIRIAKIAASSLAGARFPEISLATGFADLGMIPCGGFASWWRAFYSAGYFPGKN